MANADFITHAKLIEVLNYNRETGIFTWKAKIASKVVIGAAAGRMARWGYWRIGLFGRVYIAHRLAWLYAHGEWPKEEIDHINGNRLDNRLDNLRDVSKSVNMQNQRRARKDNKSSAYLGVSLHKRTGTYTAHIQTGSFQKNLGYFKTQEEAHQVYLEAKRKLHDGCTI